MDLADELGAQGFRSIFVVHLHGAPNHSRALDAAGDYFAETFGGFMVHLGGIASVFGSIEGAKTTAEEAEDGLPIHAGMDETSWMLFLRADLVGSAYRDAPALSGSDMAELVRIAQRDDWPGYFGSPRLATAAHGAAIWERLRTETIDIARRLLDGANPRDLPRFTITMDQSPVDVELDAESLKEEARRAERQQQWLRRTAGRSVIGDR
jgi:creatinine amidohydrolase/Fe(II)-dependent formamide hydrolase-like protein